jgi:SAM-dependent methyltransferase
MVRNLGRQFYLWACERLYHELAGVYDPISQLVSAGAWPSWRRTVLGHLRGPQVLEIGFGTGALLAELAAAETARAWHVTGLELSPAMHAVAARRLAPLAAPPLRVQAPAQQMPFADDSFDSIVSTFPAPYILETETLRECARILRPGGRLVVAGLWVRLGDARLRWLAPFFYADPPQSSIDAVGAKVTDAGFIVAWHAQPAGWAEVPLLVAELPSEPLAELPAEDLAETVAENVAR